MGFTDDEHLPCWRAPSTKFKDSFRLTVAGSPMRRMNSGRYEIYIRTFPKADRKWLVSVAGGMQPRWRRDGRELFYVAPDTRLMAVPLRPMPNTNFLEAGTPVPLFPTRLATGGNIPTAGYQSRAQYAVAADGRFLLNMASDNALTPITIVHNWTAGLKQ